MTVSIVQTKSAGASSATSQTVTLTSATTAGNALIVCIVGGGTSVSGVTLGGSSTGWAQAAGASNASIGVGAIWANPNIAGGQTSVVVTQVGSGQPIGVTVYEVSGLVTSSAVDKTASNSSTANGATFTSTATAATTQASELAVGAVGGFTGSFTNPTLSAPGWTTTLETPTTGVYLLSGTQVLSSTGTVTYSGSDSAAPGDGGLTYIATVATFKAAAGGGAVTGSGGLAVKKAALSGSGTVAGVVTGSGGVAVKKAALSGSGTVSIPASTGFPYHRLGVKVELLVNTTWTDITAFVQLRNDISISPFGRTNESSSMEAAQVTLTLNNRSGRFTAGNSSGAYYPFVQLNTRIRISVNDTSVNGTAYSGYRFWGEVSEWPATWDESGRDVYASVTASGIWRRLSQSTKTLGSPYTRYNNINIRGAWTLASYWPMEDGSGSVTFANLVPAQAAMTVTAGTPTLASVSAFPGSDAIPALNGAALQGLVSTTAHPTNVIWRFNMFLPSGGDTGASGVIARMNTSGTVARVEVSLAASGGGPLTITGFNSGGTQIFTASSTLSVWGIPLMVQVGLTQSGSNVSWSLRTILPNGTVANTSVTGSVAGTVNDVTGVNFNIAAAKYQGTGVGQCVVIYGNPLITDAAAAMSGWTGEFAGARFLRVCAEQGVPAVLNGSSTSGTTMGPQVDDTLANVLQAVEATDGGQLFETRTQFGLGYRTLATLQNQSSALTLNYAAQQLSAPLSPVDNDALTRNDVTLTNYDGYAVRAYLATGARSIQDPPNGVGSGYERTGNVSCTSHSQVNALAEQLLNSGVVSDLRYPTVTVNLARVTTASLFSAVPSMGIGDYLTLTNLPAYGGAATQKQLAWGWTETLSNDTWTITFNTIPEAPFESGFAPGTTVSGQVPGTPTTVSQAGSVSGASIAENAISLFNLAQEVLTFQFGGILSNINSVAPSNPSVGDLWFDSGNGFQIKRWDGSSWVPVTFGGANILGAGTITAGLIGANAVVAGNIAAGVVTATQLAAGIVQAGIVDGTLISGAQFVAHGSSGEILVYSGTPAFGNLIMSVSANAGTDSQGNSFSAGVYVYNSSGGSIGLVPAANTALIMTPGVTPAPVAGSPQMFANAVGHALIQDGADGQTYQTQRRTLFNPVASGTLTTLSPIFTTTCGNATYRVHGQLLVAANAGAQFTCEIAGSGSLTGQFGYTISHSSTFIGSVSGGPNTSVGAAVTLAATTYLVTIDGIFTQTVTNVLQLQAGSLTATGLVINPFSFFEVMPV